MNNSNTSRLSRALAAGIILSCALLLYGCRKNTAEDSSGSSLKVYNFENAGGRMGFDAVKLSNNTFVAILQDNLYSDNFFVTYADTSRRGSLLCVDANGEKLWDARLPYGFLFSGITATGDGGLAVVGYKPGRGHSAMYRDYSYDMEVSLTLYVEHYTADGHKDWHYSSEQPLQGLSAAICSGQDGNSIEVGGGQQKQPYRIHLINLTLNGGLSSIGEISVPGDDTLCYVPQKICASGNGFVITGGLELYDTTMYPPGYNSDNFYFTLKADASGNLLWRYQPGNIWSYANYDFSYNSSLGEDVCTDGGNMVIAAKDSSNITLTNNYVIPQTIFPDFRGNFFQMPHGTIALDILDARTGSLSRSATFPFGDPVALPYIRRTKDNHYLITATHDFNIHPSRIFLLKADKDWNTVWQQQLAIPYPASPFGILEADDGSYLMFANVQVFNGNKMSMAVIKIDQDGGIVEE